MVWGGLWKHAAVHRGQQLFWIKVNFHRNGYIMLLPQINACLACVRGVREIADFATCSWVGSLP
jgi:hypothetical protein